MRIGQEITFHVTEYLEGNAGGNRFIPRRIGFLTEAELEFFDLFCTVEKIGVKKALKAMARPVKEIADAISRQDAKWLTTLPGIGATTAEQIVTTLKRKVTKFAMMNAPPTVPSRRRTQSDEAERQDGKREAGEPDPRAAATAADGKLIEDVYQALMGLATTRSRPATKLDDLLTSGKPFTTVQDAMTLIYSTRGEPYAHLGVTAMTRVTVARVRVRSCPQFVDSASPASPTTRPRPTLEDAGRHVEGRRRPTTRRQGRHCRLLKDIKLEHRRRRQVHASSSIGDRRTTGTFTVDPSQEARRRWTSTGTDGPNKGKTIKAIYKLDGDTLTVCYDAERRRQFNGRDRSSRRSDGHEAARRRLQARRSEVSMAREKVITTAPATTTTKKARRRAAAEAPQGGHRPAEGRRAAGDRRPRLEEAQGAARAHPLRRPARPRQDHVRHRPAQRTRHVDPDDQRPGARRSRPTCCRS